MPELRPQCGALTPKWENLVPILGSASIQGSQSAVPLATLTAAWMTNLYDWMDAAYCSIELHEYNCRLGQVLRIDRHSRGGDKDQY
jgi:hypothetical protein